MAAKIYTKTGDDGATALGSGLRVGKDAPRIEACGAVDELNAALGIALAGSLSGELAERLGAVQHELFELGAELAVPEEARGGRELPAIAARHVEALERAIDELASQLPPLTRFILPGGSPGAAALHQARTACRRAERRVVALSRQERVGAPLICYLNRLSDLLFTSARFENQAKGGGDVPWRRA
ncbi:MAG: cob(I)yrinic acid a,c-diamide adenosyltransferase [Thermoanaerobaculia bacterium]